MILKKKILAVILGVMMLSACGGGGGGGGGGGDSSTGDETGDTTTNARLRDGEPLLPSQVALLSVQEDADTRARRMAAARALMRAATDPGTDYTLARQKVHTYHPSFDSVKTINFILCFAGQFEADRFINEGEYAVLIDRRQCDTSQVFGDASDTTHESATAAENVPDYVEVLVKVEADSERTRGSVDAWVKEMPVEDPFGVERYTALKMHIDIEESPSEDNVFGKFHLSFAMLDAFDADVASAKASGELYTTDNNGKQGFSFLMTGTDAFTMTGTRLGDLDLEVRLRERATLSYDPLRNTGSASGQIKLDLVSVNGQTRGLTFTAVNTELQRQQPGVSHNIAYNATHALVSRTVSNTTQNQCLSRERFRENVRRYGVFDADTGASLQFNTGFPFKFDTDNDGLAEARGHIGYWGLWTEHNATLQDGQQIERSSFDGSASQRYTVAAAPGRLIHHTVSQKSLTDLGGVEFLYTESGDDSQYAVNYLSGEAALLGDGFYKVARLTFRDNQPPARTPLSPSLKVSPPAGQRYLNLYSRQLGGSVRYVEDATHVVYTVQTYVSPADPLLQDTGLQLLCYEACPVGKVDASVLTSAVFDPVNALFHQTVSYGSDTEGNPTLTLTPEVYTLRASGPQAMTLVRNANEQPVRIDDGISAQQLVGTPLQYGLHSGVLITVAQADTLGLEEEDLYNMEALDYQQRISRLHDGSVSEYYTWETGLNPWNRTLFVYDTAGDPVEFDVPLQARYINQVGDDRNGINTYAGQTFVLDFGDTGHVSGIPTQAILEEDTVRYYPVLNFKDGLVITPTRGYSGGDLVLKALDIERTLDVSADTECSSLSTASAPTLLNQPSARWDVNIGAKPQISDNALRVIGGSLLGDRRVR